MAKFIHKRKQELKLSGARHVVLSDEPKKVEDKPVVLVPSQNVAAPVEESKINEEKQTKDMTTQEKVALANQVLGTAPRTKRIKSDRGLIERAECEKTILMEDNRELLVD